MYQKDKNTIKLTRFPMAVFGITLAVLLLMAGIQCGLVVLVSELQMSSVSSVIIIMSYWTGVAVLLTAITKRQMKKAFEDPMLQLAEAADKVAHGDFSVYLSPIKTWGQKDYMDVMIADFNKMIEELGSIETLKTDFFSNVSHEIKTPIAVIQNSAQLLQENKLSPEESQEYISLIMKASRKLTNLITNMLKLNKLEKQNIEPSAELYDGCEQLCNCIIQFDSAMEEKKIDFEADMEEKAMIYGDKGLLELMWMNLLSNAVKFTPAGGKIRLSQTSSRGQINVVIQDYGCGMSEETVKHIFDKFYQGDTSHSTEGNGLGLALVLRIIQLSDGNIQVESEEGKGTAFIVSLPQEAAGQQLEEKDR